MTTTVNPETRSVEARLTTSSHGAGADTTFRVVAVVSGLLVLAVLGLIVVTTTGESLDAWSTAGLDFFTSSRWAPTSEVYGAVAFMYGTAVVSVIAMVAAMPISVGIALFTTELAPGRMRGAITTVIDLLAAVPSVVYGLWGVLVLVPNISPVYDRVARLVEDVPIVSSVFGTGGTGRSFMTAGLILALMVTPIATSITREVYATVPRGEKDAALALGSTKWEMIRGVVFPHSFGGTVGAMMLGLGRAMGETIAVALVIGSSIQIVPNVFKSGTAMPEVIVQQWGESSGTHRSALVAIGVTLFVMTIAINMMARVIVERAERRMRGD